jgi:hypothetical protein
MKHNNEKQHLNTGMKNSSLTTIENNETQEWKINNLTTTIQQSFNNEKPIKHTNEKQQ